MKPIQITAENHTSQVINSDVPVLLEFHAPWCPTCRLFRPVMYQLAGEDLGVKIAAVNIDEEKNLTEKYGIRTIPALLFIKSGKVLESRFGYVRKDELLDMFQNNK